MMNSKRVENDEVYMGGCLKGSRHKQLVGRTMLWWIHDKTPGTFCISACN